MSDPANPSDVDDLMSSVHRLVRQQAQSTRLVLTPSLRVPGEGATGDEAPLLLTPEEQVGPDVPPPSAEMLADMLRNDDGALREIVREVVLSELQAGGNTRILREIRRIVRKEMQTLADPDPGDDG